VPAPAQGRSNGQGHHLRSQPLGHQDMHPSLRLQRRIFHFTQTLRFQEINDLSVLTVETDTVDRRILKMEYKANKTKDGTKFILKELQEVEVKLSCK
jgi:hypothetical protein